MPGRAALQIAIDIEPDDTVSKYISCRVVWWRGDCPLRWQEARCKPVVEPSTWHVFCPTTNPPDDLIARHRLLQVTRIKERVEEKQGIPPEQQRCARLSVAMPPPLPLSTAAACMPRQPRCARSSPAVAHRPGNPPLLCCVMSRRPGGCGGWLQLAAGRAYRPGDGEAAHGGLELPLLSQQPPPLPNS